MGNLIEIHILVFQSWSIQNSGRLKIILFYYYFLVIFSVFVMSQSRSTVWLSCFVCRLLWCGIGDGPAMVHFLCILLEINFNEVTNITKKTNSWKYNKYSLNTSPAKRQEFLQDLIKLWNFYLNELFIWNLIFMCKLKLMIYLIV